MESEFVFDEKSLRPLVGRPVCVVLDDETRHTGILTSCGPASIVLNGERTARPANRTRKTRVKGEASTSSVQDEELAPSTSYWGAMSLGPPLKVNKVKAVIPLAPVRAVLLL